MGLLKKQTVVPVTVITGFLGSGKSTLLNHILTDETHGQKFAVIENELGAVAIDNQIIKKHVDEEIIEVTNGCICCSIRGDLVRSLMNLYKKVEKFDGIIIETTGLADPAPIIQTFFQNPDIHKKFKLDGVVTVVDAKHIVERLNEKKADGTANEAIEQIAFADKILLNKIDLVSEANKLVEIEEEIKSINAAVEIVRTEYSKVDNPKQALLDIGGFDLNRALKMDSDFLTVERRHHKDRSVNSICMEVKGEMQLNLLQEWMTKLVGRNGNESEGVHDQADEKHDHSHDLKKENTLYRYKGILAIKGIEKKFIFQGVGMVFNGTFSDEEWESNKARSNQFVFIGKNLDKEALTDGFNACLAPETLRFPINTFVECLYSNNKWVEGTIIAHWDEGNPYRIRLENREQTEIWAPLDRDDVIRLSNSAA